MQTYRFISPRSLAVVFTLILAAGQVIAQQKKQVNKDYEPEVGQEGKDVVWVPTPQSLVEKMLQLADAKPGDLLVDLGSGDGRTVITAAKRGIKAIGVEYNQNMVDLSIKNAENEGLKGKVEFISGDLFEYDFSSATVVTMFLLPDINLRLRPQILDMKPGTRIVSNTFTMGDWTPDDTANAEDESSHWNTAYLWIVPAKVEGRWKMQPAGELVLLQEYQMISGELISGGKKEVFSEGKIRGDELAFYIGKTLYTGRIRGNIIEGSAETEKGVTKWTATR